MPSNHPSNLLYLYCSFCLKVFAQSIACTVFTRRENIMYATVA
jgi:hypothetical protein